jgi:hypothetical protein
LLLQYLLNADEAGPDITKYGFGKTIFNIIALPGRILDAVRLNENIQVSGWRGQWELFYDRNQQARNPLRAKLQFTSNKCSS